MSTSRRDFFGQAGATTLLAAAPALGVAGAGSTNSSGNRAGPIWIDALSAVPDLDAKGFEALGASSLSMISTTVATDAGPPGTPTFTYEAAVRDIARWHGHFARHPDRLIHVRRAEDILQAHREGKTAVMLNFQDATHLNGDLRNLEFFHQLGIRQIQLTYNSLNALGCGCTERVDAGLSYFGIDVIERMNALGILVDVSHCGPQTTLDAIAASNRPVCFTHTNCRTLRDHPRCKTDEAIRRLAAKGGVIGITTYGTYVSSKLPVTLDDFIRHVEHAVKLVGVDHVGIGSDTTVQYTQYPESEQEYRQEQQQPSNYRPVPDAKWGDWIDALNGPEKFHTIQAALQRRGFAAAEIDKILGGNFLRIYREVL